MNIITHEEGYKTLWNSEKQWRTTQYIPWKLCMKIKISHAKNRNTYNARSLVTTRYYGIVWTVKCSLPGTIATHINSYQKSLITIAICMFNCKNWQIAIDCAAKLKHNLSFVRSSHANRSLGHRQRILYSDRRDHIILWKCAKLTPVSLAVKVTVNDFSQYIFVALYCDSFC